MVTPLKQIDAKRRELNGRTAHRRPKLVVGSKKLGASLGGLKRSVEDQLRAGYFDSVRAIADGFATKFIRHDFDEAYNAPDDNQQLAEPRRQGEARFLDLEELVRDMPICAELDSARIVLLVSPHALDAFNQISEAVPEGDCMAQALAANCLTEDLCDEAVRRGWHKQKKGERAGLVHARDVTAWNKAGCKGPMPKMGGR